MPMPRGRSTPSTRPPPRCTLTAPANSSPSAPTSRRSAALPALAAGDLPTITINIYSGSSATGTPVQTLTTTGVGSYCRGPTTPLANGTYTAQASQSDDAGNTGLSSTTTFTVSVVPTISSLTTNTFVVGIASTFTVSPTGRRRRRSARAAPCQPASPSTRRPASSAAPPPPEPPAVYPITFTPPTAPAPRVPQQFTLTVAATAAAPVITSAATATFDGWHGQQFHRDLHRSADPDVDRERHAAVRRHLQPGDRRPRRPRPLPAPTAATPSPSPPATAPARTTQTFTLTVNSPIDELGAYRASNGSWSLDSDGTPGFNSATDQVFYSFSPPDVTGVAGDWTGSGTSDIGDFSNGVWHLDLNDNGVLDPGETFTLRPGRRPTRRRRLDRQRRDQHRRLPHGPRWHHRRVHPRHQRRPHHGRRRHHLHLRPGYGPHRHRRLEWSRQGRSRRLPQRRHVQSRPTPAMPSSRWTPTATTRSTRATRCSSSA